MVRQITKKTLHTPSQIPSLGPPLFHEYLRDIEALPLFKGLSQQETGELLQTARIKVLEKNTLLFLEGEPARRLYIVLSGWICVLKSNSSGEEAVIQIIGTGSPVIESAIYGEATYPASAQAVDQTTVLALSASAFRSQVAHNATLNTNLFTCMSKQVQEFMRQVQDTRLKTANQRLGWYLLRLWLNQGSSALEVHLPFSKLLLASYLGVERETLSRTLQQLQRKGCIIKGRNIVFPNPQLLCRFCDDETGKLCARYNTKECIARLNVP